MPSHGPHRHPLLILIWVYLPQPLSMVLHQDWGVVGVGVEDSQEVGMEVGVGEGVDMRVVVRK